MNIGILGTGSIARTMAAEFAKVPAFRCEAVCSRQQATGEALAQQFGIPKVYTDYNALLADPDIELVYIATPNSLHYAQTRAALLSGKNVLCEKPFVPTVAEADELIALAKEKHLFLFEAITTAHHPNYALAKQYLDDIGSLRIVSCTFCQYSSRYDALLSGQVPPVFDPACCGGALMDLNLYNVHFVVGLFGEPMLVSYHPNLYRNGIDTSGILPLYHQRNFAASGLQLHPLFLQVLQHEVSHVPQRIRQAELSEQRLIPIIYIPGRWSPFWKPPGRMHSWASELSTANDKLFGVFCSCQISQDYL